MNVEIDLRTVTDAYDDFMRRMKIFTLLFAQQYPDKRAELESLERFVKLYLDDLLRRLPPGKPIILNGDPWPDVQRIRNWDRVFEKACHPVSDKTT